MEDNNMAFFDEVIKESRNALVDQAIDAGRIPLGYTCSFVPLPLLSVGPFFPLMMRAPGVGTTEMADVYLSSVICPYTRGLMEVQMQGGYDYIKGWVIPASCDHIRRLNDHLDYFKQDEKEYFNYCLDLPRKNGDLWVDYYENELHILGEKLSAFFGVDTGNAAVTEKIKELNAFNKLLSSIGELRKEEAPVISGTEFHKLMVASVNAPRDLLVDPLKKFKASLKKRAGIKDYRARLLVLGGKLDNPAYTEAIEAQGGLVVADRYCPGSLPSQLLPIEENGDPYRILAEHYLTQFSCPRMMEDLPRRMDEIKAIVKEYKIDGVVIQAIKFCDLWGVDAVPMTTILRDAGIPVLRLERDYQHTGVGQLNTRIQAFLESIEGRQINKQIVSA